MAFLKSMKYFAATLIAFVVSRVALYLSVRLALLIDPGALFFVSLFLIAGAIFVFVVTFRRALSFIERWIKRVEGRRTQVKINPRA